MDDVAEILEHPLQPVAAVGLRLLDRFGDVHRPHQPPRAAVDVVAVPFCLALPHVEVVVEHLERGRFGSCDRQQTRAIATGELRARRADRRCHHDVEVAVRPHLQHGLVAGEPVGVLGDRFAGEQAHHHIERLLHTRPLVERVDTEHGGVAGELPRPGTEHHPTAGEVVEHHDAVGEDERVVVGQRVHARAEFDVSGALGRCGDEHLGAGDEFAAR